ncbi:MAG: hypothetical protein LLG00_03325 [Planctomycetaceae bacterium]|nr:hypothetical protein [Planctomycetaceae bacterium]
MIDKKLVQRLVCPTDRTPLGVASDQVIARVNDAIRAGTVKNQAGRLLDQPLDGGLIRADNSLLYPVVADIPIVLADEAIPMSQIGK